MCNLTWNGRGFYEKTRKTEALGDGARAGGVPHVRHALLPGSAAGCHWWGVIFPGLTEISPAAQETSAFPELRTAEGRVLRLRLLDWLRELGIF